MGKHVVFLHEYGHDGCRDCEAKRSQRQRENSQWYPLTPEKRKEYRERYRSKPGVREMEAQQARERRQRKKQAMWEQLLKGERQ